MQNSIVKFQDKEIELVNIDGKAYMRSSDVARALEYDRADYVSRIYDRNSDEFTPDMSFTVNLTVKGYGNGISKRPVRVFSIRGCHLIAMLANTPIAKAFRSWCLDVLEGKILLPFSNSQLPVPALDAKAIGGIVKKCAAKALKDEIANVRPAPFKVATAYEQYAFEDTIKRLVRETLVDFFAPEDNAPHPSGMAFGNWAASAVHAVGAMRSEYAALNERVKQAKALLAAK